MTLHDDGQLELKKLTGLSGHKLFSLRLSVILLAVNVNKTQTRGVWVLPPSTNGRLRLQPLARRPPHYTSYKLLIMLV